MAKKAEFPNRITTPQEFYDLFILCLWWQWDASQLTSMWTTVDKVLAVLENLKILNAPTRKLVKKRDDVRRIFRRSLFICPLGFYGKGVAGGIAKQPERLVLYGSNLSGMKEHMLHDTRIYLTGTGALYAARIEQSYARVLTRKIYLEENQRRNEEFEQIDEVVRAGMRKRYARRVDKEVNAEKKGAHKRERARTLQRLGENVEAPAEEEEGRL